MGGLLEILLRKMIPAGSPRVTTAGRATFTLGDGAGTPVAISYTTRDAEWAVLVDPDLKLGEAYVNGGLIVEQGSIVDVLGIVPQSTAQCQSCLYGAYAQRFVRYIYRRLKQFNSRGRARRNVSHHYDLDDGLYQLFLDADRQYSCAYFDSTDQILDDATALEKAASRVKIICKAATARARDRMWMGWSCAVPCENVRGPGYRHNTVEKAVGIRAAAGRRAGIGERSRISTARLSRNIRPVRPHRLSWDVRACWNRVLRLVFQQMRRASE